MNYMKEFWIAVAIAVAAQLFHLLLRASIREAILDARQIEAQRKYRALHRFFNRMNEATND